MGCVQSVEDTQAAGYQNNERKTHFQADAAAAVAEMLGAGTSTQVEVSVRCRGLPDKDTFSKSDPMCVLYAADSSGKVWTEIDRSDVVANTLNPAFPAPLKVTYSFERLQPMRLVVYDADVRANDSRKLNLNQQDFLAQGPFLLSDLLTAQGQQLTIPLADKSGRTLPRCAAVLLAEEMPNTNAVVQLSLAASKLENKDTWGKSDPFVRISKARENGEWMPVLKTEVVNNNLNPTWKPFKASMSQLCNCDEQRPLLLEVFDSDPGGTHDYIGACQASLRQLKAAAASGQGLPLLNSKKASKPGYVSSGTLVVKAANVTPRPSFLDYIRGGCTLNFLVAIDFTASNGDPRNPSSLHHYSDRPTIYEDAISAVGAVLEHYDTDRMFPAFGFGAALPPAGTVSHCFALNGTPSNPEVAGVKGIQDVYRHTLSSVRLSGPTLFAPVINAASQLASQPSSHPEYWVLLILTDGCIMDMADTLASLVNASNLPLSFIIVGVGNADFSAMEALDGDGKRLRAPNGQMAARDCVQFCELRPNQRHTIETVASKLLEELPGQVVEYFHDMRRTPPPAAASPPPAVSAPSTPPEPAAAFSAPAQQAASFAMPTPPPATAAAPPAASQDPYYPKI